MSDNEELQSSQDYSNEEEENVLLNTIKILDEECKNDILSPINSYENPTSTNNNNTINSLNKKIKENNLPYLNKNKIKEIRIKDENHLDSDKKIEDYLKTPINNNFNDNIYNICEKCMKNNNIFCRNCKKNLCNNCSKDCKNDFHKLIELKTLDEEINYYRKEIKKIKKEYFIDKEKKENNGEKEPKIYEIIDENKIINESYNEKNITYSYDILLIDAIIKKDYKNYIHYKNIKNCYRYMQKKYDINNYILLEYKIESKDKKIKIFGKNFVKNNKKICQIIVGDNEFELTEYFELENYANNNILQIKLIGFNNIINIEYMFSGCSSLKSLPDITKWNISNFKNMKYMFYDCSSLESLPDISKWNTSNVTNMDRMFYGCKSLKSLPDISKWNTSNVTNMKFMFSWCNSLESLPDISKWNTSNVKNMEHIFYNCSSLKSLPDFSKWNLSNCKNTEHMFYGLNSLK